jgi:hypothetical protein
MNRRKGKDNKKPNKGLVEMKDLERNLLTEISKELTDNQTKKTQRGK